VIITPFMARVANEALDRSETHTKVRGGGCGER
jgi:hypothetical protein